jgi:methionyl-tRNA formyltransferase
MRLVMLGTGPFAVPTLDAIAGKHDVRLVVTRPPQGRNRDASPIERSADSLGLKVWSPPTVNVPEAHTRLAALAPDLLVVCDYGEILRPDALAVARLGGINLHGSLLPGYRGAAPVQWAILRGEAETGASVIHMTPGLDAGPVLAQLSTPIDPDEDAAELEVRLAALGANLVLQSVADFEQGTAKPLIQDASQASKAPRLKKEQGAIDWSRPGLEIKNQVRGLRPWPRAYTFWHRPNAEPLRLNIDQVAVRPTSQILGVASATPLAPGTIIHSTNNLFIRTGDGLLEILQIQPAGKRSMPAAEFVRGYRIQPGDRLTS